ncbi:MAG: phenylalanine--tRNA ligase subunit alpha [Candidatus Melainabacteria bacterium]|nr:phenylalanine--tRNA ligase subunit alpha [Candidatus Melainabacteria bacterium]
MTLEQQLRDLAQEAVRDIAANENLESLEELRLKFIGRNGAITTILRGLGQLAGDERKRVGQVANEVKDEIQSAHDQRKRSLDEAALTARLSLEKIDVTLPGTRLELGHIHPLTQVTEEIISIFYGMGFTVADGPEVETDFYNFDALNTPQDHPARDEQDTFYTNVRPDVLLRSQTSTVQVRVMANSKPPLRVISPGRVYRNEEINARKFPLFHQVEGLLVDKDVTFGQLKGTLNAFIRELFGKPLKTRFRPDFFPFTEPSAELDSQCPFCEGSGCRTCGGRGWLELLGCGMVDPNVLTGAGIDPEEWSGFAFGMGIERLAMLKFGINDIRHFYNNDLRFLRQF